MTLLSNTASLVSASASGQPSSTIGGIHLGGNAVIHQLALNYTRSDGETDNKQQIQYTKEANHQRIVD